MGDRKRECLKTEAGITVMQTRNACVCMADSRNVPVESLDGAHPSWHLNFELTL